MGERGSTMAERARVLGVSYDTYKSVIGVSELATIHPSKALKPGLERWKQVLSGEISQRSIHAVSKEIGCNYQTLRYQIKKAKLKASIK